MRMLRLSLVLAVFVGCAGTPARITPGVSDLTGKTYVNRTYDLQLEFAELAGWHLFREAREIAGCGMQGAILCAVNSSRLLTLFVTVEDGGIEMSNEDYQTLFESQLRDQYGDKVSTLSLGAAPTNGNEILVWTYVLDDDTITQAFLRRGTQNFRVVVIVPERAYERRKTEIQRVVQSADIRPLGPQAAVR